MVISLSKETLTRILTKAYETENLRKRIYLCSLEYVGIGEGMEPEIIPLEEAIEILYKMLKEEE